MTGTVLPPPARAGEAKSLSRFCRLGKSLDNRDQSLSRQMYHRNYQMHSLEIPRAENHGFPVNDHLSSLEMHGVAPATD